MNSVRAPGDAVAGRMDACNIADMGEWEAMDAFHARSAAASAAELTGGGSAGYYLRQAAVEAVIEHRMRVRCAVSIHRAVLAGARAAEIGHVLGGGCGEVAGRWRAWAEGQRRLEGRWPGLGISREEYDQVAAVLEAADGPAGAGGLTQCSCRDADEQIGSPHP